MNLIKTFLSASILAMGFTWIYFGTYLMPRVITISNHPVFVGWILSWGVASGAVIFITLGIKFIWEER